MLNLLIAIYYFWLKTIEAFWLIEQESFWQLIIYCRPNLAEKDIPHRNTLCAEILHRAHLVENTVWEKLKVSLKVSALSLFFISQIHPFSTYLPSKVSFTFDAWMSQPGDPYLSITGHYIDAPIDQPNNWKLKTEQLAFETIEGRHTGKNIASILTHTVKRYELNGKVRIFSLTSESSMLIIPKIYHTGRLVGLLLMVL